MSPDALNSLFSLFIGFAFAGALSSSYQAMAGVSGSFGLLRDVAMQTFAAVRFTVFAAPFIIMRNTLQGAKINERRRFEFVMMATVLAGFWSLMSSTFFLMTLRASG